MTGVLCTVYGAQVYFKSRSNFKVKVRRLKITVPCEGSCHKNTHVQYESSITSGTKVMAKVKVFVHAYNVDTGTRAMK